MTVVVEARARGGELGYVATLGDLFRFKTTNHRTAQHGMPLYQKFSLGVKGNVRSQRRQAVRGTSTNYTAGSIAYTSEGLKQTPYNF